MIFGDLSSYPVLLPCCLLLGQDSGCYRASSPAAHAVLGETRGGKVQSPALLVSVVISLIGSGLDIGCNSLLGSFPSPGSLARSLCKYSVAAGFFLHPFQVR